MNAADTFRHKLETPGPFLAPAGRPVLRGWWAAPARPGLRTTPASEPGGTAVSAMTMWSYCRQTQARPP